MTEGHSCLNIVPVSGLDRPGEDHNHRVYPWEYFVSDKYHLAFCNVFKAWITKLTKQKMMECLVEVIYEPRRLVAQVGSMSSTSWLATLLRYKKPIWPKDLSCSTNKYNIYDNRN